MDDAAKIGANVGAEGCTKIGAKVGANVQWSEGRR